MRNANIHAGPSGKPRVALVLQGGGALGAYHAGVYQALHENGLTPDWVVGTSIGAINAALIAGNDPDRCIARLEQFWDEVGQRDLLDLRRVPDTVRRFHSWLTALNCTFNGVAGFYAPRWFSPFFIGLPVAAEQASLYDMTPLAGTLAQLVDLDYLNSSAAMRLTVSAVHLSCGRLENFDTRQQRVGIEHIMASGALPPGFPPVRVDGDLYWDGGLYSNTPLETVLADEPRTDTLCFMVDLWSGDGPEPHTFDEVLTRQKDVVYASRSQRHIDAYLRGHKLRRMIRTLRAKLPADALSEAERRELDALDADTTIQIVRLAYAGRDWLMASKDVNFSRGSIRWRWEQGYRDARRAIVVGAWRDGVPEGTGLIVHEVKSDGRESFCTQ
ncbi:patatin-like phospholipase family protein [Oxalobacteraceae bacterium OM1]|nr:patatin-like phospholipase family protein [Oxalobacteraceae bacterium OM1]